MFVNNLNNSLTHKKNIQNKLEFESNGQAVSKASKASKNSTYSAEESPSTENIDNREIKFWSKTLCF